MSLLDRLERRFRHWAVPYVTEALIAGQVITGVALFGAGADRWNRFYLTADTFTGGEVYRLITFLFIPPGPLEHSGIIWTFFAWYLFYIFGTSLEQTWGTFRYNIYLLLAWVATVLTSLALPLVGGDGMMGNGFIALSVFLAFAYLYPRFILRIFLVWPVQVRWLALIAWVFIGITVAVGPVAAKLAAAASVANFLIFFGAEIVRRLRGARRRALARMEAIERAEQPFHECQTCGANDKSHPDLEFRYCDACAGSPCYCEHHIFDHPHVGSEEKGTEAGRHENA